MSIAETIVKGGQAIKNSTLLKSNEPINKAFDFVAGTIADKGGTGVLGAINGIANAEKGEIFDAVKKAYMDGDKINWKAVGGTYVGAMAAGRILSGGGLYRDAQGNFNLPIVPFI